MTGETSPQQPAEPRSLRSEVASSVAWSAISQYTRNVLQTVFTLVLAQFLTPADYGVFGTPTWVYEKVLYWGQDRLDFLDEALSG